MWIAYNFLSLQVQTRCYVRLSCCELLTIFYLYKVLCSFEVVNALLGAVVNCLQFFIFTRFFAVNICSLFPLFLLWIAYNFLSLQGSLQFHRLNNVSRTSCELLTIFYLYKVLCSFKHCSCLTKSVVNCLQFFIFTRFFAVNPAEIANHLSCELLTIFYLYKVLCSKPYNKRRAWCVVNCLQFFIFTRFFAVNCKNVSWH